MKKISESKSWKELNNHLASLTTSQKSKEAVDQGSKISVQMTLDSLKSKYEAVLKDNGGQRNEDIETLIKDIGKK